ncbi:uncharacterized protein BO96DRAFT_118688 [Aspergillus niger CBS 101883]|uniref:uncharacterized protein n=1 Tax=Aspergillus lacticoffeatus (strain CBS 101883) TaxID=1450533 RepID=UPI000D7FE1AE|nr:uncharacterized protein BO96DRAFT_118688 [Aspergillus niger CBS 101883]PYH53747.1 hypothetical protein BO96DRAFT_118688 [Aspergillus niger CBS 101883]
MDAILFTSLMGPCQIKIHGLQSLRRSGRQRPDETTAFSGLLEFHRPPVIRLSPVSFTSPAKVPPHHTHTPPVGKRKRDQAALAFPAHLNSGLISHILLSKLQSCCSLNRAKRDGTNKKDMSCIAHNRWDLRANIWIEGKENSRININHLFPSTPGYAENSHIQEPRRIDRGKGINEDEHWEALQRSTIGQGSTCPP